MRRPRALPTSSAPVVENDTATATSGVPMSSSRYPSPLTRGSATATAASTTDSTERSRAASTAARLQSRPDLTNTR
jgi:hypothetical protein